MPTEEQIVAATEAFMEKRASMQNGWSSVEAVQEQIRAALEAYEGTHEYEYARLNPYGYETEPEELEEALARAKSYPTGYKGGYDRVVRRRRAGEWEDV